jgi:hypothetical protein
MMIGRCVARRVYLDVPHSANRSRPGTESVGRYEATRSSSTPRAQHCDSSRYRTPHTEKLRVERWRMVEDRKFMEVTFTVDGHLLPAMVRHAALSARGAAVR